MLLITGRKTRQVKKTKCCFECKVIGLTEAADSGRKVSAEKVENLGAAGNLEDTCVEESDDKHFHLCGGVW